MTGTYANVEDPTLLEKFGDAQFLVLLNRLWALAICGAYLLYDWRRYSENIRVISCSRFQAATACAAALQVLLHLDFEHTVHVVPVRGAQIRLLPNAGGYSSVWNNSSITCPLRCLSAQRRVKVSSKCLFVVSMPIVGPFLGRLQWDPTSYKEH